MLTDIRSLTLEEIQDRLKSWNQPTYRARQLVEWIYRRQAGSWEVMSNLPLSLRERLRAEFACEPLRLERRQGARDTTRKYLWRLQDSSFVESVLIPANPALYGDPSDRHTLCVSTQVGCAYGCKFCASGLKGWKRNLAVEEIVGQVLGVEREENPWHPAGATPGNGATHDADAPHLASSRLVSNLVIMGMGEPLANYDNLLKALKILNAPWGAGIGARKITISTSGLVPQIRRLADEPLQFRLAISLHGATDQTRDRLMPVNRKYPLAELAAACEYYLQKNGRMITFEYILIEGVNDGLDQVRPLAELARRLNAKINLIPYNHVEGLPWRRPPEPVQRAFLAALQKQKVPVTLRQEKGHDIDAACGQLRLKTERELAAHAAASRPATRRPPAA